MTAMPSTYRKRFLKQLVTLIVDRDERISYPLSLSDYRRGYRYITIFAKEVNAKEITEDIYYELRAADLTLRIGKWSEIGYITGMTKTKEAICFKVRIITLDKGRTD